MTARCLRIILPFLTLVAVLPLTGSAGLFGNSYEKIVRKAARYNLVPVKEAVPGILVDLQYTITSASGKPLYTKDMICLINRHAAAKLAKAQEEVKQKGYSLLIWDAWRPKEAHLALWNAVKDPRYVVPPSKGLSWHCYGLSIDLTLAKNGRAVKMPTGYDVFTKDASSTYTGDDPAVAEHLSVLQTAMRNAGFSTIRSEWWHFDDRSNRDRIRLATAEALGIDLP